MRLGCSGVVRGRVGMGKRGSGGGRWVWGVAVCRAGGSRPTAFAYLNVATQQRCDVGEAVLLVARGGHAHRRQRAVAFVAQARQAA